MTAAKQIFCKGSLPGVLYFIVLINVRQFQVGRYGRKFQRMPLPFDKPIFQNNSWQTERLSNSHLMEYNKWQVWRAAIYNQKYHKMTATKQIFCKDGLTIRYAWCFVFYNVPIFVSQFQAHTISPNDIRQTNNNWQPGISSNDESHFIENNKRRTKMS